MKPVSLPQRLVRLGRLAVHLGRGLHLVSRRFPKLDRAAQADAARDWSARLLAVLDIRLEIKGTPPPPLPGNTLVVANHVSWLDIFALYNVTLTRFVAKKEIRDWPVIGTLVTRAGTLYIDRGNRRDAARINQMLADSLTAGNGMAVFPEGTTTDGASLLPFKASLFESAIRAESAVQPVAIRYLDPDGQRSDAVAYIGDITFVQSLRRLLGARGLTVELSFAPPLPSRDQSRYALALAAYDSVAALLRLPAGSPDTPDTATGIPADQTA